jgi:hypothetical protein
MRMTSTVRRVEKWGALEGRERRARQRRSMAVAGRKKVLRTVLIACSF